MNKMDLVDYEQDHFDAIEKEYRAFLEGIGAVSPRQFVPVAAMAGVNLAEPQQGDALVQGPDAAASCWTRCPRRRRGPTSRCACRVQAVYKFTEHGDDRRIFSGRVEAGKVSVGDKVVFSPSNKISTIKSIEGIQHRAAHQHRGGLVDRASR